MYIIVKSLVPSLKSFFSIYKICGFKKKKLQHFRTMFRFLFVRLYNWSWIYRLFLLIFSFYIIFQKSFYLMTVHDMVLTYTCTCIISIYHFLSSACQYKKNQVNPGYTCYISCFTFGQYRARVQLHLVNIAQKYNIECIGTVHNLWPLIRYKLSPLKPHLAYWCAGPTVRCGPFCFLKFLIPIRCAKK